MIRLPIRTLLGGLTGALCGIAALAVVYPRSAAIAIEMDRGSADGALTGVYDVERVGQETYVWTQPNAVLALPGLDRRVAWACTVRVRGARPEVATLPTVSLSVDGVISATRQTSNAYEDVTVTVPPRPSPSGATIALSSSNTFHPGAADTRALGVMVDRWSCAPMDPRAVRPPRRALVAAAIGGAAFGAAVALMGLGMFAVAAVTFSLALAQAIPIGWQLGVFTPYIGRVPWLAVWIAAVLAAGVHAVEWYVGRHLHTAARVTAIVTAVGLYLKLLVLLHPSKPPIDVVFHAHRLAWVLDGRLFFTQPMPSGVQFPYAIGLYVFAAPWSLLGHDYVLLLRVIVSSAEAIGCLILYRLVSRLWEDRLAGGIAALLFSVVPRQFEIVGNANLTNAFGQSVALATVAAAILWRLGRRDWSTLAGFTALTAFALLCHISTLTLLGAILVTLSVLYWWRGGDDARAAARAILTALVFASVFSVAIYYGHFGGAFRSAARVRASAPAAAGSPARDAPVTLSGKTAEAARLSVAAVGWPMIVLAGIGVVPWWRRGLRDRLSLAVAAWIIVYGVFVISIVATPVGASFLRYAAEFLTRVTLATCPAIVVLAALGAAHALRRGWAWRLGSGVLLAAASYAGAQLWIDWLG